MIIILDSR